MKKRILGIVWFAIVSLTNPTSAQSLGELAERNNFQLGTWVSHYQTTDPLVLNLLVREFNTWTTAYESAWAHIHPERNRYEFAEMDNLVRIAEKYNKPLIWGGFIIWMADYPSWLASANPTGSINQVTHFNRDELLAILDDHIEKVMGRYKDKIKVWYVANEIMESPYFSQPPWTFDNTTTELRHNFWYDVIGPDYLDHVFRKAREVAPDAKLYLNDAFGWGDSPALARARCDFFYNLVVDLLNRGIPLDGVGLQYYAIDSLPPYPWVFSYDWAARHQEIKRFTDLGIEVRISESGVTVKSPYTHEKLQHQAELYQDIIDLPIRNNKVLSMAIFGLSDKEIYIPKNESWFVYDRNLRPLPAYYALKHRLEGDTTLYLHDFNDPATNPPAVIIPDMAWGVRPPVSSRYKILSSNYNGTGTWSISNGIAALALLKPGDDFWIKISKFGTDWAYWNDSDYFHVELSGDGFVSPPYSGDYSFYDRWHFFRGIWYPNTPEWLHKIMPEESRLTWADWISNFQDHSEYSYSDPAPAFTDTDTTIGYHVVNSKMSLITEWEKESGILRYYHYTGSDSADQMPLDFEFVLDSTVITGIRNQLLPHDYCLYQNYPNPFNPATKIEYSLPFGGFVTLKVSDVLGREVETLIDEYQNAGRHTTTFYAAGLTTGIYFYTLRVGVYSETKKLMVIK